MVRLYRRSAASRGDMLARSAGWPGAGAAGDVSCENGDGVAAPLPRSNKAASAMPRASMAIMMAAHGAMVCAFHCLGAAGTRDAPHSWHARDPGLTSASQSGQVVT